jgi:serine/threonine protein phosphatase PrpC
VVSNLVGQNDMRIELGSTLALSDHDTVVLASDGLFDNLSPPEIVDIVRKGPLGEAANHLRDAAMGRMQAKEPGAPSKPDDLTFLLYRRRAAR